MIWSWALAGGQDLEDVRAECAWRMGQWAAPAPAEGPPPGEAAQGYRFNQALLGCLRALATGDENTCQPLLAAARRVRAPLAASPIRLSNSHKALLSETGRV